MKLLDILQSYEFEDLCFEKNLNDEEVRCDEADSYYCMVTSQWCTLYNTLSDEQKKKQPQLSLGVQASENGIGLALSF